MRIGRVRSARRVVGADGPGVEGAAHLAQADEEHARPPVEGEELEHAQEERDGGEAEERAQRVEEEGAKSASPRESWNPAFSVH